ncbi:MAG: right-handed parallel beta-helix repeat-containing protein [Thermoplasmata archaeon]|nr:MAG: right-handed parallel beta-helix repeat-containing protein [Thermoplasmata archaeon]
MLGSQMTGQTRSRTGLAIFLALLFGIALAMVLTSDGSQAQTNPPTSGDWNIYDNTVLSNTRVDVPGSIVVYSGGHLTLNNVDLQFQHASFGGKALRVRGNAEFTMTDGSISHTSISYSYQFIVESGATVDLDGVTVRHTWHDSRTSRLNQDLTGGMVIRSHDVRVTDCTFTDMLRVGMTIDNANPDITNSTFTKVDYYTYYKDYNYCDREAYGIFIINGAPDIEGCTFSELGDYDSAYNDAGSSSSYYCYLRLNGHAIYVLRGAPTITDSLFTEVGRMHTSSSYYTYVPSVGRYVNFYFWRQENRGAIHADDPLMLEVFDCNFTGNYQGYYYYTSQAYGIYQYDGKSSIKRNYFLTNGGGGVYLNEADSVLKDNQMYDFFYYGLYIYGSGVITATNNTWNGTAELRNVRNEAAVYIYSGGSNIDLRLNWITFCQRAFYVTDTSLVNIYDTLVTNCSKKVYANSARVDFYNVTISRGEIELGWSSAEVNIYWKLEVLVTWQNSVPITEAIVQIFNESNGLLKANKVNNQGLMPALTLLQTKVTGTSQGSISLVNSPLKVSAFASAIESKMYTVPFDSNTFFQCIVEDAIAPNVEIYAPSNHHAQNETTVRLFGIAVDVGSGLDGVEVSIDGGDTWQRATGGLTWNISVEMEEGNHDIQVRGVDIAGAMSVYHIRNVTIDLTEPWLIITTPAKDRFYTNQTTLTIIGQAEIGADVFLNGEELNTTGGSFFTQIHNTQEGNNTYEVMAVDQVGNRNITLINIIQDITPPILLVEFPPEDYVTNDRVLHISGLTESDVTVTIEGLQVEVANGLFTLPMTLKEGMNVIDIQAVDLARNFKFMTLYVTYDISPPEVDMVYPLGDGAVNKSTVTVAGMVEADVDEVLVNQVPVVVRNGQFSKNFKLSEGDNLILIKITDHAGNTIERAYTLTLDTQPPALEVFTPEDLTFVTEESVYVSGRAEVGAVVTLNGEEITVTGGFFAVMHPLEETLPGGDFNEIIVEAIDAVGNTASIELHVWRDTSAPRFAVYEVAESTTNDFINITGGVEDPADVYEMYINDLPVQPSDRGYFEAYVPLDMGVNVFTITARDMAGNEFSQQVTVQRDPKVVSDTGFMGLGDSAWLIMVLCLVVGLFAGLAVLYMMERRKGVMS